MRHESDRYRPIEGLELEMRDRLATKDAEITRLKADVTNRDEAIERMRRRLRAKPMSNPRPKFGDRVRNIYASEANPIRDAIYVRRLKNLDEVTDGKGDFWRVGLGALILIASPNAETKPRADWCCTNCGEKFDIDNAKVWRLNAGQLAHNCTGAGFFVAKNYALDEGAFRQEYGGSFVPHAKDGDRNG